MSAIQNMIGIVGGLGNEAMVDLAEKISAHPYQSDRTYIFFGNSRLAYKPNEVDQNWAQTDEPEVRKKETAVYTTRLMQHFGCGTLGLACNSAHDLFRKVISDTPLQLVDMIEETARSLKQGEGNVLVMGVTSLTDSNLYQDALTARGIPATKPSDSNQSKVMSAIYNTDFGIKTAQITPQSEALLCEVIRDEYKNQGCRNVILGCTELPLALTRESCERFRSQGMIPEDITIIDASAVLAEKLSLATGSEKPLMVPLATFRGPLTDWVMPATFITTTLDEMIDIQNRIFALTAGFLARTGESIQGSYMHLPTLFIVGDAELVKGRLDSAGISVIKDRANLGITLEPFFETHFASMK